MSAPPPAEPSEGATFVRLRDVPDGWEYRDSDQEYWRTRDRTNWTDSGEVVEARPKAEPKTLVMLVLPMSEARRWAKRTPECEAERELHLACRKTLGAEVDR